MNLKKHKKGFLGDLLLYIIILFTMAIVIVTIQIVWTAVDDGWSSSPNIPQVSKDIINLQATRHRPVWDNWMILAVLGYIIAIIITAMAIRSHPVFGGIAFFILVILGIISVYLSNAYFSFATGAGITSAASMFTKTQFVMDNMPYFVVGLGILFVIVLYSKVRNQAVAL